MWIVGVILSGDAAEEIFIKCDSENVKSRAFNDKCPD
jgi:hypothetical protein